MQSGWKFWIDRGGTFTDFIAISPQGKLHVDKMLSQSAEKKDVITAGINKITGEKKAKLAELRIGTTVATNALLEGKGTKFALLTTLGMRDVLNIRYQNRKHIYKLQDDRTPPLYFVVTEVRERLRSNGRVDTPLDLDIARFELARLRKLGIEVLAVSFLHAYHNPQHELAIAKLASELGFTHVSLSHQVSSRSRYVARTETTCIDAYLTPKLFIYTHQLAKTLGDKVENEPLYMQSFGGLRPYQAFRGHNALLSGPAGGVVGASRVCKQLTSIGIPRRLLTFDMGGTSTDISLYDGDYQMRTEGEFNGYLLQTPRLAIHTIAAGGGSMLGHDYGRHTVGPASAGAKPGAVCYRFGGKDLTLTDANLYLGRLQSELFPHVFGNTQDAPLDYEATASAFVSLAQKLRCDPLPLACDYLDIAIEKMSLSVRQVCIEKGYDPRQFTLFCFGGAGAQFICQIAARLEIKDIIVHPLASVFSALGIGLAAETVRNSKSVHLPLTQLSQQSYTSICNDLRQINIQQLPTCNRENVLLEMRSSDSIHVIEIKITKYNTDEIAKQFQKKYHALFGIVHNGQLLIDNVILESKTSRPFPQEHLHLTPATPSVQQTARVYTDSWQEVKVYSSGNAQQEIEGTALVADAHTTIYIEEGWRANYTPIHGWHLQRMPRASLPAANKRLAATEFAASKRLAATELEVFYQRVHAIAQEMGFVLKFASRSVVIKERLDYSCAIFTVTGELLTSAPHIPVHLGSMSECVKHLVASAPTMQAGDAFLTNHPLQGGTHLPDLTVITPVYRHERLICFVASRGHHTDIGGIAPGSMPANSRYLHEDGVVIPLMKIVSKKILQEKAIINILCNGRYPVRNIEHNMHDLKAQLAANKRGAEGMINLFAKLGIDETWQLAEELLSHTEGKVREMLAKFTPRKATVELDAGRKITVAFHPQANKQTDYVLDFTGTSAAEQCNFNTPPAVVKSACLYVIRCLLDWEVPLNDGLGRALCLVLPPASLVHPPADAAVVAGNVETSQSICDLLFALFATCAHGQGTMNNFSCGNDKYQYYETIAGGAGASKDFAGRSASQIHMTNSHITDVEILEQLYPLKLLHYAVRRGSGGKGKYYGGDGVYRRIEFLQDMTANLLSQRRTTKPLGLAGGEAGFSGRNIYENHQLQVLHGVSALQVQKGDWLSIETPSGGGYGKAPMTDGRLYFAYGANLDPLQMQNRCPHAVFLGRARLLDFRLVFADYATRQQGAVADIRAQKNSTVFGSLYLLPPADWQSLHALEQKRYCVVEKTVLFDDERQEQALMYVLRNTDSAEGKPNLLYWWQVYKGAYLLNAPRFYLQMLTDAMSP